uniref:AlNc14C78G5169 protein n=1 Tax=Albugo laibachii Nc14 TaxID=890382 RepID=F0WEX1_9STRA|nr:AlNc14C78G5169 [Albugo laibachii Nc14]|eukprot:CCA19753.1 AlNc14C78G5169 [Albugo laibachii Nc14]
MGILSSLRKRISKITSYTVCTLGPPMTWILGCLDDYSDARENVLISNELQ